jgi:hypothetical protein
MLKTGTSADAYSFANPTFTVLPIENPGTKVSLMMITDITFTPIAYNM